MSKQQQTLHDQQKLASQLQYANAKNDRCSYQLRSCYN